jgi:hypothetical protein
MFSELDHINRQAAGSNLSYGSRIQLAYIVGEIHNKREKFLS